MTKLWLAGEVTVGSFALSVELEVAPGEVVAVLGDNGAGKSTLLRSLAGLQPLSAGRLGWGEVSWDAPADRMFVPAWHRRVGLLFQDHRLLPHLSARDNVAYAVRGTGRATAKGVALDWLDRLGVSQVASRRPRQLSGGEAQRVALARMLASSPQVILLDEPTASVDLEAKPGVRALLADTLADWNLPVVLVTHDQAESDQLASRELRIVDGRLG